MPVVVTAINGGFGGGNLCDLAAERIDLHGESNKISI